MKICVNAPNNVSIYREEVYNEIKKSNKQAHDVNISDINKLTNLPNKNNFDLMKKIRHNEKAD